MRPQRSPATCRAGVSKTGKIGTYGGAQFPGVTRFMDGMYAGIKIYNEKNGTDVKLLGWDAPTQTGTFVGGTNPWGDPAKGEQLAKQFIDQGADIVHPVAGAHRQRDDQGHARGRQVGHRCRHRPGAVPPRVQQGDPDVRREGHRRRGARDDQEERRRRHGWRELHRHPRQQGVRMSPYHDLASMVPPELQAEIDQLQADIASGAVKVSDYLK